MTRSAQSRTMTNSRRFVHLMSTPHHIAILRAFAHRSSRNGGTGTYDRESAEYLLRRTIDIEAERCGGAGAAEVNGEWVAQQFNEMCEPGSGVSGRLRRQMQTQARKPVNGVVNW